VGRKHHMECAGAGLRRALATVGMAVLGLAQTARAEAGANSYPVMAPIEQYLTPVRADEMALARSAAPPSISKDADILTLGAHGYERAVKGTNGFVCLVQRSWFSGLNDPEFWNPKERSPICFNPQGARSVLPMFLKRTDWALAGLSEAAIVDRTKAAFVAHEIPAPEMGVITYMMSKDGYLSDSVHGPWHPHLMFFLPRMDPADWGSNLTGSPVMGGGAGVEPFSLFFVPVATWSDGTPDGRPMHM